MLQLSLVIYASYDDLAAFFLKICCSRFYDHVWIGNRNIGSLLDGLLVASDKQQLGPDLLAHYRPLARLRRCLLGTFLSLTSP